MTAITGVGAYAPALRIDAETISEAWGQYQAAGITQKAVADVDEDPVTMAYEAGRRALTAADSEGRAIEWLGFATSRPPIAEEDLAARLGAMLDLSDTTDRRVFVGSTRAGTEALRGAIEAVEAGAERALVLTADTPRGSPETAIDHAAGAGSAGFVLAADGPAVITDVRSQATVAPGTRFRAIDDASAEGLGVTTYDRQSYVETVTAAIDQLEIEGDPEAVVLQAPDGKLPYRVAGSVADTDTIQQGSTVHELGDLGAASVPVSLARALGDGHRQIVACSYASGASADALAVRVDGKVPVRAALEGGTQLSYPEYLRVRGEITGGAPNGGGAYVSLPTWTRSIEQRYHLEAGRCPECGALAFPPRGACPSCGALAAYDPVRLPGTGTIETVTTIGQGGAPPEFAEQQHQRGDFATTIIALDGPAGDEEVSAPMMVCGDPDGISIGDRVSGTIRRIYTQEGVTRYGMKAKPK